MQISGVVTRLESVLGEFVSTEVQLGVSVVVLLIAVAAAGLVIPRVVDQSRRLTADWTRNKFGDRVASGVELVEDVVPISQILTVIVRTVQLLLLAVTVVALLIVWGQTAVAWSLIGLIESVIPTLTQVVLTVGLLIAAVLANNVLQDVIGDFTTDTDHVTAHQEQILTRVGQVALIVVVTISVLGVWGIELGGLLVGAGFLGIVVGMAARQTLGSAIAGFVLMFSRPFEIGDWVAVGDNDEEAIKEVNCVDGNPQPQVVPVGFGGSAVDLDVRFWISPPSPQRRWQATADVIETIKKRFDTESIGIPFPQRTVGHRDSSEERLADREATMGSTD